MTSCKQSEKRLHEWLDGELPEGSPEALEVESHVERCTACGARVEAWRHTGAQLRTLVDDAVGDVEPLRALQRIRTRIAEAEQRSLLNRLQIWWHDLWVFNRRAVAGVAAAAAMGALCAPAVVYLTAERTWEAASPAMASVVVESLEFDGNAKAVVYRPEGSKTTIIWVEPSENGNDTNGAGEHF